MRVTLYRAAMEPDIHTGSTSFARRRVDAEAYLDNPGFGGTTLWRVDLEVDFRTILDLRETLPSWFARLLHALGAVHIDWAVTASPGVQREIRARGYRWVRFFDTFPEDAETWAVITDGGDDWYGADEVEPNMRPVR